MGKRRRRRPATPGEWEDPLSNYEPLVYADDFERFLNESGLGEMEIRPYLEVGPDETVGAVIRKMADHDLFCALVTEQEKVVGVFSERDVLNRVDGEYEQVKDRPIRELMTPDPVAIYDTDTPAKALNLMAVGGFRHIPVLDTADRPIGMLGPRRVVKLLQHQFG